MVILITGASHTGKTRLAQKLLEKYQYPYFSIDHLKMGLIRSGQTALTPCDDKELIDYLWGILKEMIKTVIENGQNLIVEGCYIPFDWQASFDAAYLQQIRYICLAMSDAYIRAHFDDILRYENAIEQRMADPDFSMELILQDNRYYLENCRQHGLACILIDSEYSPEQFCDF